MFITFKPKETSIDGSQIQSKPVPKSTIQQFGLIVTLIAHENHITNTHADFCCSGLKHNFDNYLTSNNHFGWLFEN